MHVVEEMKSLSRIVKRTQVILDEKKFRLTPEITPDIPPELDEQETQGAEEVTSAAPSISEEDLKNMVDEAVMEARTLTEKAKVEADQIVEVAYEQVKGIYEKANQEGYDEGYQIGFEEGRQQSDVLIQEALNIKETAVAQYKSMLDNAEPEIIDLVIVTVEKILNKHIDEDGVVIEGLIKSALEKCAYTDDLVLRVSSEDFSYALSLKDRILTLAESVDSIEIKEDKSLGPGSCIIDTTAGSVDSSVSTQFEQIRSMFESLLGSE